jgi:membrane associated rhomboid family serine protease
MNDPRHPRLPERQPAFNLPMVVVASVAILLGIQAIRSLVLNPEQDFQVLLAFAFIPARVIDPAVVGGALPGGEGAALWSFLTYALLHADWSHAIFNVLWLTAFASPLAWRFGPVRFLLFSALGAIGGAALHLALHSGDLVPMVGASAAVSAHMAGASRFVFAAGGPMRTFQGLGAAAYRQPAEPLLVALSDRRVLIFLGVWFALNLLFGLLPEGGGIASGTIAWEAHIGGFLVGLLFFSVFDPVRNDRA